MNLGLQNPNFGERLAYLLSLAGIDTTRKSWSSELAKQLYSQHILTYTDKKSKTEQHNQTGRQIRNHLQRSAPPETCWISRYCQLFGCSADFLMGIIDHPNHEQQTAGSITGLQDTTISVLQQLNAFKNTGILHLLDFLLRPDHVEPIPPDLSGLCDSGLLALLLAFLTGERESIPDLIAIGSGTASRVSSGELLDGALLHAITQKIVEYRQELLASKAQKAKK